MRAFASQESPDQKYLHVSMHLRVEILSEYVCYRLPARSGAHTTTASKSASTKVWLTSGLTTSIVGFSTVEYPTGRFDELLM